MILPQIIVEAGFVTDKPVQGGTSLILNDAVNGKLDTGTLGTAITWTDISQWVMSFTVSRPSTRLQGPLWTYQAGTVSILLDNSDGRFDPDNLSGPYTGTGVTQLTAMVPVRVRANFGAMAYALYSGFADGWLPGQVTYEGGYAEITLPATDAFKVLSQVTVPSVLTEGAGADTGARVKDILTRAGWYTSADRNVISTGNSTLQGTTLGADALSLMQIAVDSEIGQLYVNGAGAVTFRARRDLLTDTRSDTVQAVFGDLPGVIGAGPVDGTFESGTLNGWFNVGSGTVAVSSAQSHSGNWSALVTSTATSQVTLRNTVIQPVNPGQSLLASAWINPNVSGNTFTCAIDWYDSGNAYMSTSAAAGIVAAGSTWTQLTTSAAPPAGAAGYRFGPTMTGHATGNSYYADDMFSWPGNVSPAVLPELPYAAISRASDDTTLVNDIQATRTGGALQEAQDAASIVKYLFPRTYARADLILQADADALNWANWVLYIGRGGEDRFDSVSVDPQADPANLWPQVLGREIGDRIQVWQRPAGVPAPVAKDCFIAGITHAWDSAASTWLTTWTLQDASKYGSFLTLDNPSLGKLGSNALVF